MGLFKPASVASTSRLIAWLQALVWVLIYAGLLTLVLGLAVQRLDEEAGWPLVLGGGLVAALGVVLIYVRSKIKVNG